MTAHLQARTAEAVQRGRQLVSASRELIQQAQCTQRITHGLLDSLSELRGFVLENRRDLGQSLKQARPSRLSR